jgi:hypothetical protein
MAEQSQDLLINENGEIITANGDFLIGASDGQHIEQIFLLEPGELKESPLVGIGITKKINGVVDGKLRREATIQLLADGYTIPEGVQIEDIIIQINAERNS